MAKYDLRDPESEFQQEAIDGHRPQIDLEFALLATACPSYNITSLELTDELEEIGMWNLIDKLFKDLPHDAELGVTVITTKHNRRKDQSYFLTVEDRQGTIAQLSIQPDVLEIDDHPFGLIGSAAVPNEFIDHIINLGNGGEGTDLDAHLDFDDQ